MRLTRTTLLAGGVALLVAGTAAAAAEKLHKMEVALPDGSTAHIEDTGDVAPEVTIEPVDAQAQAAFDPFAELDRMALEMQVRQQAMMQQMAAMQQAAAEAGATTAAGPGVAFVGNLPAGAHYSYYSSTTDANGCTQTVQYSSDGSGDAPKVTRASAGSCDAAAGEAVPTPATAPEPALAPAAEPRKLDGKDV
jgi:hypothetical protein